MPSVPIREEKSGTVKAETGATASVPGSTAGPPGPLRGLRASADRAKREEEKGDGPPRKDANRGVSGCFSAYLLDRHSTGSSDV